MQEICFKWYVKTTKFDTCPVTSKCPEMLLDPKNSLCQRTKHSSYSAETIYKLFENSLKLEIHYIKRCTWIHRVKLVLRKQLRDNPKALG